MACKSIQQSGFGLVGALVATMILGALITALMKGASDGVRSARKLDTSMGLAAWQAQLEDVLDCSKTMASAPRGCLSGSDKPYIELRDFKGTVVVPEGGLTLGPVAIRARCDARSGGLEVRAARLVEAATSDEKAMDFGSTDPRLFRKDEMNSRLSYDWRHPKGLLFGHDPALAKRKNNGLCRDFFGGLDASSSKSCKPEKAVRGVALKSKRLRCVSIDRNFSVQRCHQPGHFVVAIRNGVAECKAM